ncbi:hypothetical protein [Natronomonas sp. EA1]|uniref:hypothetical protein n=1 Tax=Natronomonas sp. EA1 TaxID=3421655 RepID=UPI003EBAFBAB
MAVELSERVREIARARDVPESQVFEQALERGLEALWNDVILSQFLRGELSREEAIEAVGHDLVRRAEREAEAVEEDVSWGLNA